MNTLNDLHKISGTFSNTEKMPVLFLGHGSPMNAIEENQFVTGFRNLAKTLRNPTPFYAFLHIGLPMEPK